MNDKRYVGIKVVGTNTARLWFGELVIGQKQTLIAKLGEAGVGKVQLQWLLPQSRTSTPGGTTYPQAYTNQAIRQFSFSGQLMTTAAFEDIRDNLWRKSKFGIFRTVIMPISTAPEVVMLGNLTNQWSYSWGPNIAMTTDSDFAFSELPGPAWVG
jgi:hypothetical protein